MFNLLTIVSGEFMKDKDNKMQQNKKPKALDMFNDHYNPETCLKHFTDSNGQVRVYRKENPSKCVLQIPKRICVEKGGDYNPRFKNNRPLDNFLDAIEQPYNQALADFENRNYNETAKLYIAFMIGRIRFWTPTRKRLVKQAWDQNIEDIEKQGINDLEKYPEEFKDIIEQIKSFLKNPEEITAQTLIEDLNTPNIKLLFDSHFANESLITGMPMGGIHYFLKPWIILRNNTAKPFLTSDNPACIFESTEVDNPAKTHTYTYMPLTPKLAVLIDVTIPWKVDSVFQEISSDEEGVERLNTAIVKFAESKIIANIEADWIKEMVEKFKDIKEQYSEEIVGKGTDENGREYYIVKCSFHC